MGREHERWATEEASPSMAGLIGDVKVLGQMGRGVLGNQSLDDESLDGPRSVGKALPGVGVEEGSARLLQQPTERVPPVASRRRFHQRQIRSVPFVCPRSEHLRHRRCLWDHLRPRLPLAAPIPAVHTRTTKTPPDSVPSFPTWPSSLVKFLTFSTKKI